MDLGATGAFHLTGARVHGSLSWFRLVFSPLGIQQGTIRRSVLRVRVVALELWPCAAGARDSEWGRAQVAKLAELEERSAREAAAAARRVAQLEEEASDLRRCDAVNSKPKP